MIYDVSFVTGTLFLAEVSNQMLELYEQNKVPQSQASEAEGSGGGSHRPPSKAPANDEQVTGYNSHHGGAALKASSSKPTSSRPGPDEQYTDNHSGSLRNSTHVRNNEYESSEHNSVPDHRRDEEIHESQNKAKLGHGDEDKERDTPQAKYHGRNLNKESAVSQSPQDSTKKLDREKLKAAFERRKARGDITRKVDPVDELERELEDVEVPSDSEKTKRERKQSWHKQSRTEHENSKSIKYSNEPEDAHFMPVKGQSSHGEDPDTVEEGEVEASEEADRGFRSASPRTSRKRKPGSPLDRNGLGRIGYSDRDHKRHLQENHV